MALGKKLGTNAEVCLVDYKVDAPIEICSRKYPRKSFLDYSFAPRRASAFVLLVSLSSVPGTSSRYCDSWQESNMCRWVVFIWLMLSTDSRNCITPEWVFVNSTLQYLLVPSLDTDVMDIIVHAEILPSTHNNWGNRKYFCMEQRGLCLVAYMHNTCSYAFISCHPCLRPNEACCFANGHLSWEGIVHSVLKDVNKRLRPASRNLRDEFW